MSARGVSLGRAALIALTFLGGGAHAGEAESPDARWGHMFIHFPPSDSFVLYGGASARGSYRSDMWAWDGASWRELDVSTPPARGFAAVAYDPVAVDRQGGRAVLFGGKKHEGEAQLPLGDLWMWENSDWRMPASSEGPQGLP